MHQFIVRDKTGFTVLTVYSRTAMIILAQIQSAYPASEGYSIGHHVERREREFDFKMAA
jgi:hypothetical protein